MSYKSRVNFDSKPVKRRRRWIDAKVRLPASDKDCELICEKGKTWGFYDKEFGCWFVNVTRQFVEGDVNIGKVLKWRYKS